MNVPKLVGEAVIYAVLVGWTLAWAAVVWLNYSLGDLVGAGLTLVLFVLGTVAIIVHRMKNVRVKSAVE